MPHAWNALVNRCWSILASRDAKNPVFSVFCLVACLLAVGKSSHAQPYAPIPSQSGLDFGDPYQMVAPASENFLPSGLNIFPSNVLPTGLFGGGHLFNGRLFGRSDSYGAPPSATQLNQPMVVIDGPIFEGGPVYNTLGERDPLFSRVRSRIDSRLYLRAEYLIWNVSGMHSSPLVTTSPNGTPRDTAAVLGEPGTSVLFGGNELNDGAANGVLIGGGMWLTTSRNTAFEMEYFQLASLNDGYNGASDGTVILGRPFFDIVAGRQSALLVSYPDLVSGSVNVTTKSELRSFLINGRFTICPNHANGCQQCGMRDRTDWIVGYRNIRLRDSLTASTDLISELPDFPGTVAATDQFKTKNEFNGLQLGVIRRRVLRRGWLESSMRVALGNNRQTQQIGGSTTYNESGVIDSFSGGLLAQRTNSGERKKDEFVMVPELGLRWGFRWSDRFHTSIGYTVLYFPNVIRAAEQIDTDLNPGLIPEETDPLTGALRPRAIWVQSDYLAHGLHLGAELHF